MNNAPFLLPPRCLFVPAVSLCIRMGHLLLVSLEDWRISAGRLYWFIAKSMMLWMPFQVTAVRLFVVSNYGKRWTPEKNDQTPSLPILGLEFIFSVWFVSLKWHDLSVGILDQCGREDIFSRWVNPNSVQHQVKQNRTEIKTGLKYFGWFMNTYEFQYT